MGQHHLIRGAAALACLAAVAGCGPSDKTGGADTAAASANLANILDPTKGSGPWFICDAVNAPAVLVVGRPTAAGEVTLVTRDKTAEKSAVSRLMLGAAKDEAGSTVRPLSRDGAEVGFVRTLAASALPDPAAVTTPPISEVKIDDKTFACRWLAHTRLIGVTTRRTAFVTDAGGAPTYLVFEFKDAATAAPTEADPVQRSTKPSLEIAGGHMVADVFRFESGDMNYAVGDGGITTMQSGRVVSGEPFAAAQTAQVAPAPQ